MPAGSLRVRRSAGRLTQVACAAAASLFLAPQAPVCAKTQQVPATRVTIDVPEGFAAAKPFAGFINAKSGASIVIVEMPPQAFVDFKKADFAAKLAASGFANVAARQLSYPAEHIYITAEQATGGGAVSKFLLIFADAQATAMLTVNVLKSDITSGKTKTAEIESMLATARLAAEPAKPQPVPFTLNYTGPFKAAGTTGGAYLYALDGKLMPDKPEPGRAVFVVASSIGPVNLDDIAQTSTGALISMFDLDSGTVKQQGAVKIGGLDGYEIEIEAPRKSAGPQAVAYQVILKTKDGGYVRMVGTGNATEGAALIPEFRKMAASFLAVP